MDKLVGAFVGLVVLIVVAVVPAYGIIWSNTHTTVTCTVEEKDRTTKAKGGSDQRLYTDCGVLSVADDWINGQWNSSDLYSQLDAGETYTFETVGWRNGFLSAFPNVVGAEVAD